MAGSYRHVCFLVAFALTVACQNDDAGLPSEPRDIGSAGKGVCAAEDSIRDLFSKGLANAALQQCQNIQRQYARGRVDDAYDKLAALTTFVMEHLSKGRLSDPDDGGPETAESGAAHLIVQLNMIVGLSDGSDEIPTEAFTSMGGTVQTIDAEEPWDVETRDGFAGVTKAAGVPVFRNGQPYTGPVTVFIAPIAPSESNFSDFGLQIGGPDRGAFPLFKDIGTIPGGLQFGDGNISEDEPDPTNEIVVELCIVDPPHPLAPFPSQLPDLRVGHIVDGETLEVAPLASSTLDCTGVNDEVPIAAMFQNRWHRWANLALGPTARLFDVAKLHARPGALGGRISAFSEFGGIDQTLVDGGGGETATVVYVANSGTDDVSVIDVATNTVTMTVNVGDAPQYVAITPDGSTAYVTNFFSDDVSVIDVATNTVTMTVNVGDGAWHVAITPDGSTAYVTNATSDDVSVIDVATNTVTTTINAGDNPRDLDITPDGSTAYVTIVRSVSVIDLATNAVTTTVNVGLLPLGVAITPDGSTAYVTDISSNNVSVIDVATNTVTMTVNVGDGPQDVTITPDGSIAYVTNSLSNDVSVIDVATNTVTTTINVGGAPQGVAITP